MRWRPSRRARRVAGGVLLVLVAAFVAPRLGSAPMPPDSATSEGVLTAFLEAARHGDCGRARALTTRSGWQQIGSLCGSVTAYAIGGEGYRRTNEVGYATTLTIRGGISVAFHENDHTRFFTLGRDPGGPWRISGGGTGP